MHRAVLFSSLDIKCFLAFCQGLSFGRINNVFSSKYCSKIVVAMFIDFFVFWESSLASNSSISRLETDAKRALVLAAIASMLSKSEPRSRTSRARARYRCNTAGADKITPTDTYWGSCPMYRPHPKALCLFHPYLSNNYVKYKEFNYILLVLFNLLL